MSLLSALHASHASRPIAAVQRRVVVLAGVLGVLALSGSQGLLPAAPVAKITHTEPVEGTSYYLDALWPGVTSAAQTVPVSPAAPVSRLAAGPYGVASPSALTSSGIPAAAYRAYVDAATQLAGTDPGCGIGWSLIAGIGRVESNHGRYGGSTIGADGIVSPPILGVRLDGSRPGMARINDSDDGRYDGDTSTDRAVGPMQFLPGTWKTYGRGANPQDMNAAALAAGRYLCAGGGDLTSQTGRWAAVFRYNHSDSYVSLVLSLASSYETGTVTTFPSRPSGTPQTPTGEPGATAPGPPPGVPLAPTPARPAPSTGSVLSPTPGRTTAPAPATSTTAPPTQPSATSPATATAPAPAPVTAAPEPTTAPPTTSLPPTTAPAAGPSSPAATTPAETTTVPSTSAGPSTAVLAP